MAFKRISRKVLKIAAFICGGFLVLLTAFHFWFINHAEELIEEMVASRSHGKLKLEVKKFRFNWFTYKMELRQATFYSTDTATASTGYRFKVQNINVGVQAILPLIFDKRIVIDSLMLIKPSIEVTKLRARDTTATQDTSLSIPQEMGRIYNSIQDALQLLKVDRFQIQDGQFTLINKVKPAESPVSITHLDFHLDNLQVDSTDARVKEKILFSDNVMLRTHDQDIVFPDGRHRLSFGNFRINILKRMVEFDSCTIAATRGDSANNSFRIFFDKLMLTNINFDTLYHSEFIQADSVYCINPQFKLDITLGQKNGASRQPPRLDELIRQLTGDMHLNFVVVQNGSFDINTVRNGKPSSFTSSNNNFDLQGLNIQKSAVRALTVERFAMAIRNYENFLRDSSYAVSFDSILINNSRISLSNFAFRELQNGRVLNSLSMPQFELQGLSWDELVFDRYLKADNVTLYKPVIDYTVRNRGKQQNVFQVLAAVGNLMRLNNVYVVNGDINLHFAGNSRLKLEHTDMSVRGEELVGSKKIGSITHAVPDLSFTKGVYRTGSLIANLGKVQYNGKTGQLQAATVQVKDSSAITVNANNVIVNRMLVDERGSTTLNGVSWVKADLHFPNFPGADVKNKNKFQLTNISGRNTRLSIGNNEKALDVFLDRVVASGINKQPNAAPVIEGLSVDGNGLQYCERSLVVSVSDFHLGDHQKSTLSNFSVRAAQNTDSSIVQVPALSLVPDLNAIIAGNLKLGTTRITRPVITISATAVDADNGARRKMPALSMEELVIDNPIIHYIKHKEGTTSTLDWNGQKGNNIFTIANININDTTETITADRAVVTLQNFLFGTARGKKFDAGAGRLDLALSTIKVKRNEIGSWDWRGTVDDLAAKDFRLDSLGKNNGRLYIESAALSDLLVSSSLLLNVKELVRQNTSFTLAHLTGGFQNSNTRLRWYNAGYRKQSRLFSIDSFSYAPALSRDSFVAAHPYQADHITIRTGSITAGPFDADRYLQDTIVEAGVVAVNDLFIDNYRDQRRPRFPGLVKLLPVDKLKQLGIKLTIDSVVLQQARIDYEEMNEKTNKSGKITVADLNANITQIRNFNLADTDSLHIKATANIAGTIPTRLDMKESYTDTLGGFLLRAQMRAADLIVLNPILIPLLSAELRSGQLDTMSMNVTGNDRVAYGQMNMNYHDLKVRMLKNGEPGNRSFFTGILNFFANTLIKNNNKNRTGNVFFERLRDRSAANYLFKITLSGVTSSVGVKSNKKKLRKYKKELNRRSKR